MIASCLSRLCLGDSCCPLSTAVTVATTAAAGALLIPNGGSCGGLSCGDLGGALLNGGNRLFSAVTSEQRTADAIEASEFESQWP
jgi:hypothetical protein